MISNEINACNWASMLPFNFQKIRIFEGKRPIGFRFSKHIITIEAKVHNKEVVACGEDSDSVIATAKAISELIERSSIIEHAQSLECKTSNGWAAHPVLELAKTNAMLELVERDGVLSNWYTRTPYLTVAPDSLPSKLQEWQQLELAGSEYPHMKILLSTRGIGPSVTCILMNKDGFGVTGHATKKDLCDAIESALAEACRSAHHALRMSYVNEVSELASGSHKTEPGAHALFYAYIRAFPNWIFGKEISFQEANNFWESRIQELSIHESDFKFTELLSTPVHVVRAENSNCLDISWGTTKIDTKLANRRFADNNTDGSFNTEPHFVA